MLKIRFITLAKVIIYIVCIIFITIAIYFGVDYFVESNFYIEPSSLFLYSRILVLFSTVTSFLTGIFIIRKIENTKFSFHSPSLSWYFFILLVILTFFISWFIGFFIMNFEDWLLSLKHGKTFTSDNVSNIHKLKIFELGIIILKSVILIPILEEVFFRGCIFKLLLRPYKPLWAIIISGLLFGLYHGNFSAHILTSLAISGIIFAFIYWRFQSLWLVIILHALLNLIGLLDSFWLVWFENLYAWQFLIIMVIVITTVVLIYLKFIDKSFTWNKLLKYSK